MDDANRPAPTLADLIFEQTADAMIYADRQGLIQRWNAAAVAMFGHAVSEAQGKSLDIIIPEHLRAAHWRGFEAAMRNGTTRLHGRPTLTRAVHKSGLKLYVEMSFALIVAPDGAVLGSIAMVRDATERIEREKRVAQGNTQ